MGHLSRRAVLKLLAGSTLTGFGGTLGSYLYASTIEPELTEITRHSLVLPRLQPAFNGLRLVHLSDLHITQHWMTPARLRETVATTNALTPDIVVITGDIYDDSAAHGLKHEAIAVLSELRASEGVFAVLGNHDYWSSPEISRETLQRSGIRELPNAVWTLRREQAELHLAGLDDLFPQPDYLLSPAEQRAVLERVLRNIPPSGAAILLVHEPDIATLTAEYDRFDLQLSGHSHGGQVRLPFKGELVVPPLGQIYVAGRYTIGSLIQYTSRGIGMAAPRVRLNCRPEIALFELRSAQV